MNTSENFEIVLKFPKNMHDNIFNKKLEVLKSVKISQPVENFSLDFSRFKFNKVVDNANC